MGDADEGAGSEGMRAGDGAGPEGMPEEAMSIAARSHALVNFVAGLLATHGWTIVFLAVVWYNCKDAVRRRWRKRLNEQSITHANRPERRAVLDRERARAVALKQAEATEAARSHAEENSRKKVQAYSNSAIKDD